jgi:hypothetical protein
MATKNELTNNERDPDQKDGFDMMREIYENAMIEINSLKKRVYDLEMAMGILEISGVKEPLKKQPQSPFIPPTIEEKVEKVEIDPNSPFAKKAEVLKTIPPPKKKLKLNKWVWIILLIIVIIGYFYVANSQGWTCAFGR